MHWMVFKNHTIYGKESKASFLWRGREKENGEILLVEEVRGDEVKMFQSRSYVRTLTSV